MFQKCTSLGRLAVGIALTGYVVPGCVEDGTWILWETSYVAAAVVATAVLEGRVE